MTRIHLPRTAGHARALARVAVRPALEGSVDMGNVRTYRGLRYAEAGRFRPSSVVGPGTFDDSRPRGPVPPQNPSRFEMVLGPQAPLDQSEDCLVLSVATPGLDGARPVLMWFHGGANLTGGGELPWHDGAPFAEEQDVVVVTVTARLGLLGFLRLDDADGPTLATGDQLRSIDWVVRHIGGFGGDPTDITLAGQSAGATAVEALLRWGVPSGVRGAILQSGYRLCEPSTAADASRRTAEFLQFAGQDPTGLPTAELLDLQQRFVEASPAIWTPVKPDDGRPIDVPVIAGWTRDDGLAFAMLADDLRDPSVRAQESTARAAAAIADEWFIAGARRIVAEAGRSACPGWLYEFAREEPTSGWGAPHCADLPYLFGEEQAWRDAPMLRGADRAELWARGADMRREWAGFMRHRDPGERWTAPVEGAPEAVNRYYSQPGSTQDLGGEPTPAARRHRGPAT